MITKAAIKLNEVVYTGTRHGFIIRDMVENHGCKPPITKETQGFVDELGNFYTRKEALAHVLECGQITELKWPPTLYSEDLW